MRRERSSRCSEAAGAFAVAIAVGVVLLAATVAPAAAVTATATDVPERAPVGSQITATVVVAELFQNPSLEQWSLSGETQLTNVTWAVTLYDQAGNRLGQEVADGPTFTYPDVTLESGVAEIEVKVTGTVPTVGSFSYEPPQSFEVIALEQTRQGGTTQAIENWSVHHFTDESRVARQDLDNASAAVASAGSGGADTAEAQATLENAIDAYDGANFALATRLAGEARNQAQAARQSRQLLTLGMYVGLGLLAVLVLAGAYWYVQQRRRYDRLA